MRAFVPFGYSISGDVLTLQLDVDLEAAPFVSLLTNEIPELSGRRLNDFHISSTIASSLLVLFFSLRNISAQYFTGGYSDK